MVSCVLVVGALLSVLGAGAQDSPPLSCRDPYGYEVEWYVLYKFPELKDADNELVRDGVGYMYVTSSQFMVGWEMAPHAIGHNDSAVGRTLAPLYRNSLRRSLRYVLYNDQPPEEPPMFDLGHTKGVLAFEHQSGFWIVHSVPHFPPTPSVGFNYPETGHKYGQTIMCITLPNAEVDNISAQLLFNKPYIYASQLSAVQAEKYPVMDQLIRAKFRSHPPWFNIGRFVSLHGSWFTSYAKTDKFNKDLYSDLMAPTVGSAILTETWMNGPRADQLRSDCSHKFSVKNVRTISARPHPAFLDASRGQPIVYNFTSTHDHSKWAVSADGRNPWVCVGDINRMRTQERRGGGTVCFKEWYLWKLFVQLIVEVEPCAGLEYVWSPSVRPLGDLADRCWVSEVIVH